MEALWVCIYEELEKATGMTQTFSVTVICLDVQLETKGRSWLKVRNPAACGKGALCPGAAFSGCPLGMRGCSRPGESSSGRKKLLQGSFFPP